MASTIKLKNGSGAPLAADLVTAEPALDLTNKRLYTEDSLGNVIEVGTNPTSLTTGDITTTGAVDVTGDLDVDNINIDGNAITSTDTNGNITITPNGTGEVDISKVDIDSGTIDGTTIGGTTTAAGSFTTLQADTSLNVDGTVTADGLTVEGASLTVDNGYGITSVGAVKYIADSDNNAPAAGLIHQFFTDNGTTLAATIAKNGDISFYEDTGTTAKFFWDASAEKLGIGYIASSPNGILDLSIQNNNVYDPASYPTELIGLRNLSNTAGTDVSLYMNVSGNGASSAAGAMSLVHTGDGSGALTFQTRNSGTMAERLRITSAGNVGIGTQSPSEHLEIFTSVNETPATLSLHSGDTSIAGTQEIGAIYGKGSDSGASAPYTGAKITFSADGTWDTGTNFYYPTAIKFYTQEASGTDNIAAGPRLTITSTGNVGIGTTSPTYKVQAGKTSTGAGEQIAITSLEAAGSVATPYNMDLDFLGFDDRVRARIRAIDQSVNTEDSFLSFSVSNPLTEAMRIDSTGIDVTGTVTADGVVTQATANTYPDGALIVESLAGDESYVTNVGGTFLISNSSVSDQFALDSSGNVGIGTSSPATNLQVENDASTYEVIRIGSSTVSHDTGIYMRTTGEAAISWGTGGELAFYGSGAGSAERMRIDSSGNLLVSTTDTNPAAVSNSVGVSALSVGKIEASRDGNAAASFNRKTSDGNIVDFRKEGSTVGSIGTINSGNLFISGNSSHAGLQCGSSAITPMYGVTDADNTVDLGALTIRYDDVYATNGTIQTSDRNEKQDIEELSEAEQRVAVAAKGLLRKFRWIDAVEEKGDDARIHFGIIAQDLQTAFEAEGLDAGRYAMFIHSEWWETQTEVPAVEVVEAQDAVYDDEGNLVSEAVEAVEAKEAYTRTDTYDTEEEAPEGAVKKSRMGVRYSELLAFIIAAI